MSENITQTAPQHPLPAFEEKEHEMTETSETSTNQAVEERATVDSVFDVDDLAVYYGDFKAVREVSLKIRPHEIAAFIGPSGCGKSTVLRCFNRMNDLIPGARVEGSHHISRRRPRTAQRVPDAGAPPHRHGVPEAEPVPEEHLRQRRLRSADRPASRRASSTTSSSESLRGAALWDEVKDRLKSSALGLSGGQQQRLCIARALAVEPDVILMDEPCSALDPIATARIEDLMHELKRDYTIVIVTHNMQQAARVSDRTAFFTTEVDPTSDRRTGVLVEFGSDRRRCSPTPPTSAPRRTSPAGSARSAHM